MTSPYELNGPLAFERQQGQHTIPVIEIPPRVTGGFVPTGKETQYPFQVFPTLPPQNQLFTVMDEGGVLCFPNVIVQTNPTESLESNTRLSVFIAHGGRNAGKKHVIGWGGKTIESSQAFASLTGWCDVNGVTRPQVFVSCDERVGPMVTRWDQRSGPAVIGFSGGLNWILSEPITNTLIIDMGKMRRDRIGPNPLTQARHLHRPLVNQLFKLRISRP